MLLVVLNMNDACIVVKDVINNKKRKLTPRWTIWTIDLSSFFFLFECDLSFIRLYCSLENGCSIYLRKFDWFCFICCRSCLLLSFSLFHSLLFYIDFRYDFKLEIRHSIDFTNIWKWNKNQPFWLCVLKCGSWHNHDMGNVSLINWCYNGNQNGLMYKMTTQNNLVRDQLVKWIDIIVANLSISCHRNWPKTSDGCISLKPQMGWDTQISKCFQAISKVKYM